MRVVHEYEDVFLVPPTFAKGVNKNIDETIGEGTPVVDSLDVLICVNTGAQLITNLLKGSEGQILKLKGDGQTTLDHGTWIFTSTGADKLLAVNKMYTLTCIDNKWYEDAY